VLKALGFLQFDHLCFQLH